jgi:glycosyltransferase involved in cell wall biosynthesis
MTTKPEPRRKVLFIAFHFPPLHGSSGLLRTLKFVRYIGGHGYRPYVLTAHPRVYEAVSESMLKQIPAEAEVFRAFALNVKKDLSFRGRYLSLLAVPDRFAGWIPFAVLKGLYAVFSRRIDLIFSTYPIPSAHVIGLLLAKLTRRPWIADMRDPMWDEHYRPSIPAELKARQAIEAAAVRNARGVILTTEVMRGIFRARYPDVDPGKFHVISNGYDENDFKDLALPPREPSAPVRLRHLGLLEPLDRDPRPFFRGIRTMLDRGKVKAGDLSVELFSPGHEKVYAEAIASLALGEVVRLRPSVAYQEALGLMAGSDVLLLFQGPTCEGQVPAKLYEYMRVGRPILALTTATGETGRIVLANGAGAVVPIDDCEGIARLMEEWILAVREGRALPAASQAAAQAYSRQKQAEQLATCLGSR